MEASCKSFFNFVICTNLMLFRIGSNDDNGETSKERKVGMYDAFSESQTESQVLFMCNSFYS